MVAPIHPPHPHPLVRRETIRAMRAPTRPRQRPADRGRPSPSPQQVTWIEARDGIGEIIDRYLAADPEPRERLAIALVEESLRRGDHAVGLLP